MDRHLNLHQISARKFIDRCKNKFGWSDLSNDVIMDVGCGDEGFCGKSLLEKFPDARTIIGIDNDPKVARNFMRTTAKIECVIADIEKRETLKNYEGRMTKVISTYTFHQLVDKEEAFRNVYYVLKPGGEAAILLVVRSLLHEWLTERVKNPKWKETSQCPYVADLYKSGVGSDYFKEIAEKIGFRVLECSEEKRVTPYRSDQVCKESLYDMCRNWFKIPPETLEEFKEESLQVLLELSGRDSDGRPCYRSTELRLLLVKPTEGFGSETKNLGS